MSGSDHLKLGAVEIVVDSGRSAAFGKSKRLLTSSNMLFSNNHDPHVETRTVNNVERRRLIQANLGNRIYSYNRIKDKKRENGNISTAESKELEILRIQIKQLREALKASTDSIGRRAITPAPVAVPFTTHGASAAHDKLVKYDNAPRFYRSEMDWDFGAHSRYLATNNMIS